MPPRPSRFRELQIARDVRERYGFDDPAAAATGPLTLTDLATVRRLAQRINEVREVATHPDRGVRAGALHAAGLLHEWQSLAIDAYSHRLGRDVMNEALAWLTARWGEDAVGRMLQAFASLYTRAAGAETLRTETTGTETTETQTTETKASALGTETGTTAPGDGVGDRSATPRGGHEHDDAGTTLHDLLLLWLTQQNPACRALGDLFDDRALQNASGYREIVASLDDFFTALPSAARDGDTLLDHLTAPIEQAPRSLRDQLASWHDQVPPGATEDARDRLLLGIDVLREEEQPVFVGAPGPPPPPPPVDFEALRGERARFSDDRGWMPSVVLVAKNALVWLDQLSKAYRRPIRRLDEIPEDALDQLAAWGFDALWLIGIWQRSQASATIKQRAGNPQAAASAYAIDDYRIAPELGGDEALEALSVRAAARGIRLACDMVPNHVGIDGRWVVEHPERLMAVPDSPFPNYRFTGEDLSASPEVSIFLEDGYTDQRDAAVVFKRVDNTTGDSTFVYHGNDGTALPWNDTAQLDYLVPGTREAVIDTILQMARRFPIIRFDAAMTLARQHVQRLWYPPPGEGGAIPSRSEHALHPEAFDRLMPDELWREVVERIAEEAPDTLLLAEAFWLMEGYFVRTLGMHRVYNSAFMHRLRDEDNRGFRHAITETLAFDPGILARHVNFLTTPDEESAAEQVGTGDKYLALATVLATLPGLPLFGHGQIEGLYEKYGMEYRRPDRDERPDPRMIAAHEARVAPLLVRRSAFAGVDRFRFFDTHDATTPGTPVLDDVFAYSNCGEDGTATLVVVHNRDRSVTCHLHTSVPQRGAPDAAPVCTSLAEALGLSEDDEHPFVRLHDPVTRRDHLRSAADLRRHGLTIALGPYEARVWVDIRPCSDADGTLARLSEELGESGTPDLDAAVRGLRARPVQAPFARVLDPDLLSLLWRTSRRGDAEATHETIATLAERLTEALHACAPLVTEDDDAATRAATIEAQFTTDLETIARALTETHEAETATATASPGVGSTPPGECAADEPIEGRWIALIGWAATRHLGALAAEGPSGERAAALVDRWRLDQPVHTVLRALGMRDDEARAEAAAARLLLRWQRWADPVERGDTATGEGEALLLVDRLLADADVRNWLGVNRFDDVWWFDRDAYRRLRWWLLWTARVEAAGDATIDVGYVLTVARALARAEDPSDYRIDRLRTALGAEPSAVVPGHGTDPAR